MAENLLVERLMDACHGPQRRSQVTRTVEFLRFVIDDMRSKRGLRERYARNTVKAYRRHLEAAGVAPLRTFEDVYWLVSQISLGNDNGFDVASRLLWVLNDDRHRTKAHAESVLRSMLADHVSRLAREIQANGDDVRPPAEKRAA